MTIETAAPTDAAPTSTAETPGQRSGQLKRQRSKLSDRRAVLAAELQAASDALDAARAALISGRGDSAALVTAQATSDALRGALTDLDSQLAGLETEIRTLDARKNRTRRLHELRDLAHASAAEFREWAHHSEQAQAAAAPHIAAMLGCYDRACAARNAFIALTADLTPGGIASGAWDDRRAAERLLAELEAMDTDLDPVLFLLYDTPYTPADRPGNLPQPGRWGLQVTMMLDELKRQREIAADPAKAHAPPKIHHVF